MIEKMTIFYKLRNLEIDKVAMGEQNLKTYARMDLEDAQLVYGFIVLNYDDYAFNNNRYFNLVDNNGVLELQLKEEYKTELQKYL